MARTTIPANQIRSLGIQDLTVAPGELAIPFGVCDFTLGDQTPSTGKEILVFQNVAVAAKTVTIDGAADVYGRDAAITTYSIPAGGVIITGILTQQAFRQSDGMIYINAETADVKVAVLRVP